MRYYSQYMKVDFHFLRMLYWARSMEHRTGSSVDKVLDVLLLFTQEHPQRSIDEIQQELHLPQSTVYRYVRILTERGFLHRVEPGYYRLGAALISLSRVVLHTDRHIRLLALPSMKRVAEQTGESVSLMRIANRYAVCIESIEGQYALRVTIEQGRTQLLHTGASSKVLMAFTPESDWESLLEQPLKRFTENTITELDVLYTHLRMIREQGYAVSDGEIDVGARAVAVPLLNKHQGIIAALSIEAPYSRMNDKVLQTYIALLQEEAAVICDALN